MADDKKPPGAPPPRGGDRPSGPPPRPARPSSVGPTPPSRATDARPTVARPRPAVRPPRPPRPAGPPLPWRALLAWPVALTTVVTLLRFAGELLRWPEAHFSRLPGGGLATVGITWLVPAVGFWVGFRLHRAGHRPDDALRAAWQPLAALAAGWAVASAVGRLAHTGWTANLLLWAIVSLAVTAAAAPAWPAAARALAAYAAAARGLVVVVMALAIARGLGTHYDALPPGFPADTSRLARFLLLGLIPQATIWLAFTVAVGLVFAALGRAAAAARRGL